MWRKTDTRDAGGKIGEKRPEPFNNVTPPGGKINEMHFHEVHTSILLAPTINIDVTV